MDRLSAFHIGSVREVTGGRLISSFSLDYPHKWLGRLKDVGCTTVEDRKYEFVLLSLTVGIWFSMVAWQIYEQNLRLSYEYIKCSPTIGIETRVKCLYIKRAEK